MRFNRVVAGIGLGILLVGISLLFISQSYWRSKSNVQDKQDNDFLTSNVKPNIDTRVLPEEVNVARKSDVDGLPPSSETIVEDEQTDVEDEQKLDEWNAFLDELLEEEKDVSSSLKESLSIEASASDDKDDIDQSADVGTVFVDGVPYTLRPGESVTFRYEIPANPNPRPMTDEDRKHYNELYSRAMQARGREKSELLKRANEFLAEFGFGIGGTFTITNPK